MAGMDSQMWGVLVGAGAGVIALGSLWVAWLAFRRAGKLQGASWVIESRMRPENYSEYRIVNLGPGEAREVRVRLSADPLGVLFPLEEVPLVATGGGIDLSSGVHQLHEDERISVLLNSREGADVVRVTWKARGGLLREKQLLSWPVTHIP